MSNDAFLGNNGDNLILGFSVNTPREELDRINVGKTVIIIYESGRVAQSVGYLTRKSGVLSSIPGLATYFRFSFC